MIHSWYRTPDKTGMNTGRTDIMNLENYLPVATIETLSYLDYFGEKIYSCVKQLPIDSDEEETDWEILNSGDLYKLMEGVENYLQTNIVQNHEAVKEEVSKLKIMSSIAQKYNLYINLFVDNP